MTKYSSSAPFSARFVIISTGSPCQQGFGPGFLAAILGEGGLLCQFVYLDQAGVMNGGRRLGCKTCSGRGRPRMRLKRY